MATRGWSEGNAYLLRRAQTNGGRIYGKYGGFLTDIGEDLTCNKMRKFIMAHLDNSAHIITHYASLSVVVYFSFSPPTNQAPPLPQKNHI